jgi:hypothetical protein
MGFFFALAAIFPRSYHLPANFADVVNNARLDGDVLKARMVGTLVKAHQTNQCLIAKKGGLLKWSLVLTSIGLFFVGIGVGIPRFLGA